MTLEQFLTRLNANPETIQFSDTISVIDQYYDFTPSKFVNGDLINEANQNNGSCKIIAFSQLNKLNKNNTLHCFGDYYRQDVLKHPENTDHQNIRNLMIHGPESIEFTHAALALKNTSV